MNSDILFLASLVAVVLFGSAFCSGVEAALLSVNPLRVHELAEKPNPIRGARKLAKLRQRLGRTLTVVTIANNSFNIFGSLMLGIYATFVFTEGLHRALFSIGLTMLVLLVSEILPKSIGAKFPLRISLASAPILHLLSVLMRPLILPLEHLLPVITAESEISTDEEEIQQMAKIGSQQGQIEADEAAMISKVFQLNDLTARDLMTPRVATPTLDGSMTLDKLRTNLLTNNSQCWVVLGKEVDKVLGIAKRERLLTALVQGHTQLTPLDLCEAVEFVPEMIRVDRLLTCFNKDKTGTRVVVDEFGGFVGLIGAESVLAVLAGWWRTSNK
ncbi:MULTISPECIES: CNNM domain-containing protein [unclassified Prochlorococcus]|uniref:CNNM domain-containing protein n=1 Tax=unclassified Prochlorococcus TaxID=2627481 RepID=UPI000533AD35|nr:MULTISPECIES: CNNM domain-containing protein [unclassified Prochlorococcus]KGG14797.1 Membrane associated SBC domain [Prochlorococcus sp. MIT 0602]KGG15769.1 Membrane associated SBC domain [Prochlorococcus sp. MIT 0603]